MAGTASMRTPGKLPASAIAEWAEPRPLVDPVEGSGYGLLPQSEFLLAFVLRHSRNEALVFTPLATEFFTVFPKADCKTCRVSGTYSGRLCHQRPHHRNAQDVCLELHQGLVLHHATIHLELGEIDPSIGVDGIENFPGLEGRGLQGCASYVTLVDESSKP